MNIGSCPKTGIYWNGMADAYDDRVVNSAKQQNRIGEVAADGKTQRPEI